jgi:hypothetical protein
MSVPSITLRGRALTGHSPQLLPAHVLASLPSTVKLGRVRKAEASAPALRHYLRWGYTLPTLPVDWTAKATAALARMYLNDALGCCVVSDAYHRVGLWTGNATGTAVQGTDAEVEATYRVWNPGRQDNGCVITDVLDYCRDHGITVGGVNHKIDGYVKIDWTNWDEWLVAVFLFGAMPLGINLPDAWTQNDVWDVTNTPVVGGHDVAAVAVPTADGALVSSWGRLYRLTRAAATSRAWVEEAYAPLSPDWYANATRAPNLIDAAALKADLAAFGHGTIPDVGPAGPNPPPNPAVLWPWTLRSRVPRNGTVSLRTPVALTPGTYGTVRLSAEAHHLGAVPWASILQALQAIVAEYGPLAMPYVEGYLDGLNLPPFVKALALAAARAILASGGRRAAVPWTEAWAKVWHLLETYGPLARPYIDGWVAGLPPLARRLVLAVVDALLGANAENV